MSKKKVEVTTENPTPTVIGPAVVVSEKQRFLELYKTLQDLGVRSISDLENLIARAE